MQTFDNTRPLVAAMAVGLARACLDRTTELLAEAGVAVDSDTPHTAQSAAAARLLDLEADHASAYLLTLKAAWLTDQREPNSMAASMAKAKAGRTAVAIAGACVELCGPIGYAETELVEKWARDAKILDIFEGTQQIQLLVVARRLLDLTSAELA
jgi:acyl-CoA dehydrogenase